VLCWCFNIVVNRIIVRYVFHSYSTYIQHTPAAHIYIAQPDWWFMGGRIFPGETPLDSCCRLLDREMKLYISPTRLRYICTQTFAFSMRQQVPRDHGTTDVQLCYMLQLTNDAEVSKVILDPMEYSDGAWVLPSEIVNGNYHPALKYAIKCMLTARALQTLQDCVESEGGSDAEIANLTREFLTRRKDVNSNMMITSKEEGGVVTTTTTTTMCNNDYVLDSKELNYRTTVQTKY